MPTTRTLIPSMAWSCQICNQPAPRPPLADLVSNPTPPGQISRDGTSQVYVHYGRESSRFETLKVLDCPVFNCFWVGFRESILPHRPAGHTTPQEPDRLIQIPHLPFVKRFQYCYELVPELNWIQANMNAPLNVPNTKMNSLSFGQLFHC